MRKRKTDAREKGRWRSGAKKANVLGVKKRWRGRVVVVGCCLSSGMVRRKNGQVQAPPLFPTLPCCVCGYVYRQGFEGGMAARFFYTARGREARGEGVEPLSHCPTALRAACCVWSKCKKKLLPNTSVGAYILS